MGYVVLIAIVLIFSLVEEFGWGWVIAIGILLGLAYIGLIYSESERAKRKKDNKKKKKLCEQAKKRFSNSEFVSSIIQDFKDADWQDLNYARGGCQVLHDKIVTPLATYHYSGYELDKLDSAGCEQLAIYIGELYGKEYDVEEISRGVVVACNSYSGRITSNGNVSVSQNYEAGSIYEGHRVYSKASVPKQEPKKKW